jgi:small subunit ribosomal protein S14
MAKTSSVEKNKRRAKMAKQYAGKRAKLKAIADDKRRRKSVSAPA